jgi:hypothetical protein
MNRIDLTVDVFSRVSSHIARAYIIQAHGGPSEEIQRWLNRAGRLMGWLAEYQYNAGFTAGRLARLDRPVPVIDTTYLYH